MSTTMGVVRGLAAAAACAVVITWAVSAQSRPDFTGTWVVDAIEMPEGGAEGPDDAPPTGRPPGGTGGMGGGMPRGGARPPEGDRPPEGSRPSRGPAAGQKVVIKQTPGRIIITTHTPDGDQMIAYTLDGHENTNVVGPATVKSKTKWDGATLVTDSTARIEGRDGRISIKRRETRSLEDDGETMVVRTTVDSPRGKVTNAVFYRRAG